MHLPVGQTLPPSRRRWRLAVAGVLILGVIVWAGADRLPANATHITDWRGAPEYHSLPAKSFRVASFNIHSGKGADARRDLDRIAGCIAEVRPDFVGLNEVHGSLLGVRFNQADELGRRLNMASQFVPAERRFWQPSFGNGLLSKVATSPVHKLPLPCTQGKKYRIAALTSFEVGGQTVRVLAVHLDRVKDRDKQMDQIFSLFCELESPAILMGDLNALPHDPRLKFWLETHPEICDVLGKMLGADAPPRRIDWILTRGLIPVDAGVLENEASDHPLVWAELQLPGRE